MNNMREYENKYIKEGIREITKEKFNINSYNKEENKYNIKG